MQVSNRGTNFLQLTDVSWSCGFPSFEKQLLKAAWHALRCGWFHFPCPGFPQDMLLFPVKMFSTGHEPCSAVAC